MIRPSSLDPAIANRLKRDPSGLVPAVTQQYDTGEVLMLGWMDDEALHRTLTTGRCTYWSRSRQEYWVKGETSGHQQWVKSVALDCDGDTLLVKVASRSGRRYPSIVSDGSFYPDATEFARLATDYPVVPVTRRVLADGETPVGVYRKLAGGPGTFLLESAENGRSWSRYSFIGVRSQATLTERSGEAVWLDDPPPGVPLTGDPLEVLRACAKALRAPRLPGMPPLMGGLVGYLSYDFVRRYGQGGRYAMALAVKGQPAIQDVPGAVNGFLDPDDVQRLEDAALLEFFQVLLQVAIAFTLGR